MSVVRLAINGAAGRMGQRLVALGSADPDLKIAAAIEYAAHPRLGQDAGQIAGVGDLGVALSTAQNVPASGVDVEPGVGHRRSGQGVGGP